MDTIHFCQLCVFNISVFDDEDENKLAYTEIHEQYKKLVSSVVITTIWLMSCIASASVSSSFILLTRQNGLL